MGCGTRARSLKCGSSGEQDHEKTQRREGPRGGASGAPPCKPRLLNPPDGVVVGISGRVLGLEQSGPPSEASEACPWRSQRRWGHVTPCRGFIVVRMGICNEGLAYYEGFPILVQHLAWHFERSPSSIRYLRWFVVPRIRDKIREGVLSISNTTIRRDRMSQNSSPSQTKDLPQIKSSCATFRAFIINSQLLRICKLIGTITGHFPNRTKDADDVPQTWNNMLSEAEPGSRVTAFTMHRASEYGVGGYFTPAFNPYPFPGRTGTNVIKTSPFVELIHAAFCEALDDNFHVHIFLADLVISDPFSLIVKTT